MKEQFKKLTLLVFHRDKDLLTSELQDLGVIHLEIDHSFRDEDVERLEHKRSRYNKVRDILIEYQKKAPQTSQEIASGGPDKVVDEVLSLSHRLETNVQLREAITKDKVRRMPWGDFDFSKVHRLSEHGIKIAFCVARAKEYDAFSFGSLFHEVVYRGADFIYFVVLGKENLPQLPFEVVKVPQATPDELDRREASLVQTNQGLVSDLKKKAGYLPLIEEGLLTLGNKLSLAEARGSYQSMAEGSIECLKGWYPINSEPEILKFVQKLGLVYTLDRPGKNDQVPILLRNKKYPRLFEQITKIFELPGYYEFDLTPFTAVFYPILFAYCLGDAGYGVVLFAGAAIGYFTFLKGMRSAAALGMILGLVTSMMGVVKSGSLFGIPLSGDYRNPFLAYLSKLVVIPDDQGVIFNAFNVALMIGVLQILVGITISILNKWKYQGFLESISQIGKLLIVTSLIWIFLADMQGVAAFEVFPWLRTTMFWGGIVLVLFFHDLSADFLPRVFSGVLPLFFIFTGILGDILSYVRLFALGVASSVLGLVVNQIGLQIIGESWWSVVLGILFLLFGHGLNFGIAILGSFVHPLRLTFVEFYNNAQFTGGGKPYEPFKKKTISIKP